VQSALIGAHPAKIDQTWRNSFAILRIIPSRVETIY
jgi:hypothetical protein